MSFVFQALKAAIGSGFDWSTADVRLLLLASGGGFSEDPTIDLASGIDGILDAAEPPIVTGRTVERDDEAGLARWHADAVVFPDLEAGHHVDGAILFVVPAGDPGSSWPAIYLSDVSGLTNGTDFTVSLDPAGVLRIRDAA